MARGVNPTNFWRTQILRLCSLRSLFLILIFSFQISAGTAQEVHHEDHEDEAAKAVRSILGHNDFEVQSEKLRIAHQQQQQSGQPRNEGSEANNNKDLSTEMKRTSSRLRELVSPTSSSQQPNNNHRGLKRPSNAVEIQYVTAAAVSESKLDAPGKCVQLFVY